MRGVVQLRKEAAQQAEHESRYIGSSWKGVKTWIIVNHPLYGVSSA